MSYQASSEICLLSQTKHLRAVLPRLASSRGFLTSFVERPFMLISVYRTVKTVASKSSLWFERPGCFLVKVVNLGSKYSVLSLESCDHMCNYF